MSKMEDNSTDYTFDIVPTYIIKGKKSTFKVIAPKVDQYSIVYNTNVYLGGGKICEASV